MPHSFSTIFYAFITGVVVPMLIQIINPNIKMLDNLRIEVSPLLPPTPRPAPLSEHRVVAQGVGRTPEEAWFDALRNAVRSTSASLVDGQTWVQSGTTICDQLLKDERGIIPRCEDLRCTPENGGWRREVAVVVARDTLAERLKAAHLRVVTDAP